MDAAYEWFREPNINWVDIIKHQFVNYIVWKKILLELDIFLFTTASKTALGPTQPPIQWVLGALSLGAKRPMREADHSPPSNAEVKEWGELYLHSPIRLHGMVLS
jgi:hypothetical protein